MTPVHLGLGPWLRAVLTESGKSQTILAKCMSMALNRSIDKAAVNKMTLGKRAIAGDELLAIAAILDVPVPTLDLHTRRIIP